MHRVGFSQSRQMDGILMSLTTCPECSGKVSDLASACPHCGAPVAQAQRQPDASNRESFRQPPEVKGEHKDGVGDLLALPQMDSDLTRRRSIQTPNTGSKGPGCGCLPFPALVLIIGFIDGDIRILIAGFVVLSAAIVLIIHEHRGRK